jgi:rhamnosyltransferase
MKRVLIFGLLGNYNSVPDYVLYSLEHVQKFFSRIIIVAAGEYRQNIIQQIQRYGEVTFVGVPTRSSMLLWREGLQAVGLDRFREISELYLLHDQGIGPLFEFPLFAKSDEFENGTRWKQFYGLYHPSAMMEFGHDVIVSKAFLNFWHNAVPSDIIPDDSPALLKSLKDDLLLEGFIENQIYENGSDAGSVDPDHGFLNPNQMIKLGIPYLDLNSVVSFRHVDYVFDLVSTLTDYPLKILLDHLVRLLNPNEQIDVLNKNVLLGLESKKKESGDSKPTAIRAAVHLHLYYVDIAETLLKRIADSGSNYSLFVTTDSTEKLEQLKELARLHRLESRILSAQVVSNRGRDVLHWLNLAAKLNEFDLVGHFHTKKTDWSESWVGESWLSDMMDALIDPADEILSMFESNSDLGIVIPDIPYVYKIKPKVDPWGQNRELCMRLWEKMGLKPEIDFMSLNVPVMPFGNMFWYRPAALKPLFDLEFELEEFPEEPFPKDGTVAHALERLHVYIAWSQGYDFRIAHHVKQLRSTMDLYSRARVYETIQELKKALKSKK